MAELRARNRALAEDLLRQAPAIDSADGYAEHARRLSPAAATADASAARALAEAAALRHQVTSLQGKKRVVPTPDPMYDASHVNISSIPNLLRGASAL